MSPDDGGRLVGWATPPLFAPLRTAELVVFVLLWALCLGALWRVGARSPVEENSSPPTDPAVGARPGTPPEGETVWTGASDLDAAELRVLVVARLRRFVRVAADPAVEADVGRRRLTRLAVFSAYCDCVELGLDAAARETLLARPTFLVDAPPGPATSPVVPIGARLV